MMEDLLISLSAFAALLPSALVAVNRRTTGRGEEGRDATYWLTLAVAVAGPLVWVVLKMSDSWHTGLSTTLWVTIAASMVIFAAIVVLNDMAWRLTPLMTPYMALLAIIAIIWSQAPEGRPLGGAPGGWIQAHILVSVATYALVTIAAVSALAAFLQERALKTKNPTALTRLLPSVSESESLLVRLLIIGEIVLGLGLATGMASQYQESGAFIDLDHKSILSVFAFVVIGGLLATHFTSGTRGRRITRLVLLAYLLLTLGYLGVKFVTDVLLG